MVDKAALFGRNGKHKKFTSVVMSTYLSDDLNVNKYYKLQVSVHL